MENRMEATIVSWSYIGMMEKLPSPITRAKTIQTLL